MTVAIVGASAMGGPWAAKLAAGHQVAIVDVSPDVVNAVSGEGLIVQSTDGAVTVRPQATTHTEEIGPVDIVFFFVKAHHTAATAELARPLVDTSTAAVSLQNGWGSSDVFAGTYPPNQMVVGVTYCSATVLAPGRIAHTANGPTFVGPFVDGSALDRAARVQQLLVGAGFEVTLTPDIKSEIWKKLTLNASLLSVAALTGLHSGTLATAGPLRGLIDALIREVVQVARSQGYDVDVEERTQHIYTILADAKAAIATGAKPGKGSMAQDVEGCRKTEIDVINGAVVRAAERLDIEAPFNRAMVALIHGVELGWQ